MPTDCHSNRMPFDGRMAEVAGVLAAGILRRRRREMKQTKERSFLNTAQKSVHCTNPLAKGESR